MIDEKTIKASLKCKKYEGREMSYPILKNADKPVKTIVAGSKTLNAFLITVEKSANEDDFYLLYRLQIIDNKTRQMQRVDLTETEMKTLKYFLCF